MLARWIAERCRAGGLLRQPNVLPVSVAPVDEFEVLMGFAARGDSLIDLLTRFTSDRDAHSNLNNFLYAVRQGKRVRLPELEETFHRITEETKRRLFPKSPQPG